MSRRYKRLMLWGLTITICAGLAAQKVLTSARVPSAVSTMFEAEAPLAGSRDQNVASPGALESTIRDSATGREFVEEASSAAKSTTRNFSSGDDDRSAPAAARTPAAASDASGSRPLKGRDPARRTFAHHERAGEEAGAGDGSRARAAEFADALPAVEESQARRVRTSSEKLTAGSIDDHRQPQEFQRFLDDSSQRLPTSWPQLNVGRRMTVEVVGRAGAPIQDAQVTLRQDSRGSEPLSTSRTGSDGRTYMFSTWDGIDMQQDVRLQVTSGRSRTETIVRGEQFESGQNYHCRVRLDRVAKAPRRLDLSLVVDTTGSMDDELEYLKNEVNSIAGAIKQMFPNVQQRYSLVAYRDHGDDYVCRTFDFTESLGEFQSQLDDQTADGGGNYPEAMHAALQQTERLNWSGEQATRIVFLVGDAPPHDEHAAKSLLAIERLRQRGVRVYPVGASGVRRKAELLMRYAAFLTSGEYIFLTDHSGIGRPHDAPHVDEYEVEYLRDLMVRKIAAELSGDQRPAREVLAIESGAMSAIAECYTSVQNSCLAGCVSVGAERLSRWTSTPSIIRPYLEHAPRWLLITAIVLCVCMIDALLHRGDD